MSPRQHLTQLDTVRAISIGLVLLQHFSPRTSFFGSEGTFPVGFIGVDIFFVLSGFLITRSLLREREEETPVARKALRFTARRALRLFPVYYLVLFLGVSVDFYQIRDFWPWMFGYASNFLAARDGHPTWGYTQFWSLAVEEQFYLLWPWIVWLAPAGRLRRVFVGFVVSGLVVRSLMYVGGASPIAIRFSTPALLDLFGMGALLAHHHHTGGPDGNALRISAWIGAAGLLVVLGGRLLHIPHLADPGVSLIFFSLFGAMIYVHLINGAARGHKGLHFFWENRFLIHIGKTSYGIYIYHNFILLLLPGVLARAGLPAGSGIFVVDFAVLTALSIGTATLSWHLLEKRVLAWKERL
jgi:peptidoglycan/LPS O-acetylase OafA/YrhL